MSSSCAETLDDIIRNDKRAGAVIDRLRAMLRKDEIALQPVDLNEVAREVVDLAYGELRVAARDREEHAAATIPPVLGDRVQLQQVVLNLVLNACDAMNSTHATDRQLALSTMAGEASSSWRCRTAVRGSRTGSSSGYSSRS